MKFLIDAQLPYRLRSWLSDHGYDAVHTLDLPAQNQSSDQEITRLADLETRVVVTKDSDFLKLHVLQGKPARLLLITTGNIINEELLRLFEQNLASILGLFERYPVVELNKEFIIGHGAADESA